jgi:glutamyl-tRNA reductase
MSGRLLMVGLSHHAAPLDVRSRVAVTEANWRAHAPADLGTVLVSTCNRLEVYAWIEGRSQPAVRALHRSLAAAAGVPLAELKPFLKAAAGRDALLHLVRVASGLDSLVVGEEQIRGQVRDALRSAEKWQALPASLRGVFHRAGESARRVRGTTRLGNHPSMAAAGVNVARRMLASPLEGELALVLGAGVMARAAAEALLEAGARVRVLNRTPSHAERTMGSLRGSIEVGSLNALPLALSEAVLVVGATASREPVIRASEVEATMPARNGRPLLLLDIALPRDIDPRVRGVPGLTLIDMDDLERYCPVDVSARQAEQQQAEGLAAEEAERLAEWLRFRAVSPAIAELRTFAESIRKNELRRSAQRLRDLTPEQSAAVEALTAGIVNKLMHGPTVALRDAAARSGGNGRSHARILRLLRPTRGRRTA